MPLNVVNILFRWIHIVSACLLVGSVFYFLVLLPLGTRGSEPQIQETVHVRCRRGFKMTVHVTLLLFLISGVYNVLLNWHIYTQNPGAMHGLFGLHLLLGLGAITLLMIALAGREPRISNPSLIRMALIALIIAVAAASTLKAAREYAMLHPTWGKHVEVRSVR